MPCIPRCCALRHPLPEPRPHIPRPRAGFAGGVFGRGRGRRQQSQRDDSNFMQLGAAFGGRRNYKS